MACIELTQDKLMESLSYDAVHGQFHWNMFRKGTRGFGERAGTQRHDGYRSIRIDQKSYLEHRLAWLYVHGDWPAALIDHIDRNPSNNRIMNLRIATHSQNKANRAAPRNNSSGHKGVSKLDGKWRARITVMGHERHLGTFPSKKKAAAAYAIAAKELYGQYAGAK